MANVLSPAFRSYSPETFVSKILHELVHASEHALKAVCYELLPSPENDHTPLKSLMSEKIPIPAAVALKQGLY